MFLRSPLRRRVAWLPRWRGDFRLGGGRGRSGRRRRAGFGRGTFLGRGRRPERSVAGPLALAGRVVGRVLHPLEPRRCEVALGLGLFGVRLAGSSRSLRRLPTLFHLTDRLESSSSRQTANRCVTGGVRDRTTTVQVRAKWLPARSLIRLHTQPISSQEVTVRHEVYLATGGPHIDGPNAKNASIREPAYQTVRRRSPVNIGSQPGSVEPFSGRAPDESPGPWHGPPR